MDSDQIGPCRQGALHEQQSRRRKGVRAGSAHETHGPVAVVGPGGRARGLRIPSARAAVRLATAGSATTTPGTTVSNPGISAPPFGDNNPAKKRQGEIECGTVYLDSGFPTTTVIAQSLIHCAGSGISGKGPVPRLPDRARHVGNQVARPGYQEVFQVTQMRHAAHLLSAGVVDADLSAHVAFGVEASTCT